MRKARWTEGDSTPTSRLLEDAIPLGVSRALRQAGVEPARTDRGAWVYGRKEAPAGAAPTALTPTFG